MKTLLTLFVFALTAHAQSGIFGPPTRFRQVYHSPGAGQSAFPSGISEGYTVQVIDGDSSNPCTTGGGSTKSWCRYSGSAWQPVGTSGGGGGGGVSSIDATGGVETASGSAITGSGTVRGSFKRNAQTGTTYTVLTGDRGKTVTFSNASSIAVTLPQAGSGFEDGWFFVAKNIGAGTVTITPTTSTVDGAATITLLTGDHAIITSDGTNYETDNNKIISGSGVNITTARTGKQAAADTAVMLSRATHQAGALRCASSTGSDDYKCNMTPTLTAYTDGMVIEFEATVAANTGAATLQIDSLAGGGKAIKLCDGSTDPANGDIAIGKQVALRYDGTVFRLPCNPALTVPFATGTSVTLSAPSQIYICTSTCTVTPPVPAAGYQFCVMNGNNVSTVITMAAIGSSARYENTARTAYGTAGTGTFVSGGAAADKVCLLGLDSTHYLTVAYQGTWTAN